jgi:hypothetical protein
MNLSSILIGRRLANQEGEARKITAIEGVPAMGLDGLGSSAYGPEAGLTIFISLGAEGLHLVRPIMAAILVLLALLYLSIGRRSRPIPAMVVHTQSPGKTSGQMPGCLPPVP